MMYWRGFEGYDRGRLIMACGTGKTFLSLRLAESMVGVGGTVVYFGTDDSVDIADYVGVVEVSRYRS